MSKGRKSQVKDTNISSKLLGANLSDINIQKFRDLTQIRKEKYDLGGKITLPILKTLSNKFSPDVIFTITLPGQAIANIDCLSDCVNIMVLNLSQNNIENLLPLKYMKKLRILNLSGNCITNMNPLEESEELVNLHLEGNMIKGLQQLQALRSCPALKNVYLQSLSASNQNPICDLNNYRNNVINQLTQLKRLDGVPITMEGFANGSQLKSQKKKDLKIQIKNIGPFYTNRFPNVPAYAPPSFKEEPTFKKSISGCKTAIQQLEIKLRTMMAS